MDRIKVTQPARGRARAQINSYHLRKVKIPVPPSIKLFLKVNEIGTRLLAQCLRLHPPNAGGPGSNPGQRMKISRVTAKTKHSQIHEYVFKK